MQKQFIKAVRFADIYSFAFAQNILTSRWTRKHLATGGIGRWRRRQFAQTLVVSRWTSEMKNILFIYILILLTNLMLGQTTYAKKDSVVKRDKHDWTDTNLISIKLISKIDDKKIIAVDIGKKATIYISKTLLRQYAVEQKSDYNKKSISKIIHFIDSASVNRDTIFMDKHLAHLDYLVSDELQNGNATVYYKKQKLCVPTISHRLEKYGMYAHRFFYLPDRRPFFSTMEMSGILEKGKMFSDPKELGECGKKLASLNQE